VAEVASKPSLDVGKTARAGVRYLRQGKYRLAAAALDRVLRVDAEASEVGPLLRRMLQLLLNDKGSEVQRAVLEAISPYRIATLHLALMAIQAGRADAALVWLGQLLRDVPDDDGALLLQGLGREVNNDLDGAISSYTGLIGVQPQNPEAFLRRAAVFVALEDEARNAGREEDVGANVNRAIADYSAATELDPGMCDAYLERARVRAQQGDIDGAERDYAKAIECCPESAVTYQERGSLREAQRNYDDALHDYDQAVDRSPDDPQLRVIRGHLLIELGEIERARFDYDAALKADPGNPWAYRGRAQASMIRGDTLLRQGNYKEGWTVYEDAVRSLDGALQADQSDPTAHWLRGLALRSLDGYDLAFESLTRAIERIDHGDIATTVLLLADQGETLRLWGHIMHLPEMLQKAVAHFQQCEQVARDTPELFWIWGAIGTALTALSQHDDARVALDTALSLDPSNVWARIARAKLAYLQGDFDRARAGFEWAIQAEGPDADVGPARIGRGQALERLRKVEAADEEYEHLVAKPDADSYLRRGALFEDFDTEESFGRAEADYRRTLELDPNSTNGLNSLAWLLADKYRRSGILPEALELASRAVELASDDVDRGFALDTRGWILHRLGRHHEAVVELKEAVSLAQYRVVRRTHLHQAEAAVRRRRPLRSK
jgi:tetratricopeptide (TPR) repeat protein